MTNTSWREQIREIEFLATDAVKALLHKTSVEQIHEGLLGRVEDALDFPLLPTPDTDSALGRLVALRAMEHIEGWLYQSRRKLVKQLRSEGVTWDEIGEQLGVTRSAAQQRFAPVQRELDAEQLADADA
jgi:hypothetical protein